MTRARDVADTQDNLGGAVPPFAAGKNKIINGDFNINQRNLFTFSNPAGVMLADRWLMVNYLDGTNTVSIETFTLGTAPVAGYEAKYFARMTNSGAADADTQSIIIQRIEDVRTFAGQTATVSFWAKADSAGVKVAVEIDQNFGTGGSPSSRVITAAGQVTLSTSWARYSVTVAVPSISGKTLGTNNNNFVALGLWTSAGSDYNARTGSLGIQNNIFDFWGVQVEAGSIATPFQTATGTIQGELSAAQRYYYRQTGVAAASAFAVGAIADTTTSAFPVIFAPVVMRAQPSSVDFSLLRVSDGFSGAFNVSACVGSNFTTNGFVVQITSSGLTAGRAYYLQSQSAAGFIGFNAEL
jgi:hypothetical protein